MDVTKPPAMSEAGPSRAFDELVEMDRIFERILAGEVFLSQLQRGFAELTASTQGAEKYARDSIAYPPDRSY